MEIVLCVNKLRFLLRAVYLPVVNCFLLTLEWWISIWILMMKNYYKFQRTSKQWMANIKSANSMKTQSLVDNVTFNVYNEFYYWILVPCKTTFVFFHEYVYMHSYLRVQFVYSITNKPGRNQQCVLLFFPSSRI